MHPVLTTFDLFGHTYVIHAYGSMLALAMLVGGFVAVRTAGRTGIDIGIAMAAVNIIAFGGLIGAYVLQVVVETIRTSSLTESISRGGLVFYGAPIGGFIALITFAKPLQIPVGKLIDAGVVGVPITHALGRMGCFLAGCCYGEESKVNWAVQFNHPLGADPSPVFRHPVQLYEAAGLLVLALIFICHVPEKIGHGRRAAFYLIAYAFLRIGMERFRGDADRGIFMVGVSTSDFISVVVILVSSYFLWKTKSLNLKQP